MPIESHWGYSGDVQDLSVLYRKLERASFSQREQIADEVVREMPHDQIATLVRGLEHPQQGVRLGVIEILARAGSRESLRKLMQHARDHDGDDRVFALRALASLAQPGDDFLADSVRGWLTSRDPFVEAQAQKLARILASGRAAAAREPRTDTGEPRSEPKASTPSSAAPRTATAEPLERLVVRLFAATKGSERVVLVDALERRGPQALAAAAKLVMNKATADLVALVARALIRHSTALPADTLVPALEAARKRLGDAPIAEAAIDDALVAFGGAAVSPTLLARLGSFEPAQLDALVQRLAERPAGELALHAPALLDAVSRRPAVWSSLGPLLARAAPELRDTARGELRRLAERVVDQLRRGERIPAVTAVSVAWVIARLGEPGEPLPRQLRGALERLAATEAVHALCALCARLATEEAAAALIAMLRDPLPEARAGARDALATWQSPWIRIDGTDPPAIVATYRDEHAAPLERRGDRLVAANSEDYVLDGRGRPVPSGQTELGGCLCCSPPRALVRRRGEGMRCPTTWECHLRDGDRTLFERDHPQGRCKRCDSIRPRVRDGARTICLDCRAGLPDALTPHDHEAPVEPDPESRLPSEHGRGDRDALPKPPTADELAQIAPRIRAAIVANVFIIARDGYQSWNGSGIIIARDGNHIAILTNRHVVESDDGGRLLPLEAMTVAGEAIKAKAIWRAKRGVDLAIIEARVEQADLIGVMPLGTGSVLVGAEVFAIGNPLGLAWSYSAGTLSAIRHWTTQDGESVRILQTDASIAPGSSGGGLFHSDGHLLGVMSFGRQGHAGSAVHFAFSIESVKNALQRDKLRWRNQSLAD